MPHLPHVGNGRVGVIAVCLTALTSFHCDGAGRHSVATDQTLTIHVPDQDERVLGPLGANPWFLVFLGLTTDPDDTGAPRPRLLDRWQHTPDYKEWTIHVRDGVRWDDGTPVTADDVKFSLELWTNPEILYEYRYFDTIAIRDPQTLHVTFKEPVSATIFTYDWLAIVPKHLLDTLNIDDLFSWPFWIRPVGDGPFRYVRHIPGTMTELAANPAYYGERPRIKTVILRYGGNPITELLSGNVDVATSITPLDAVRLQRDSRFRVYHQVNYQHATAIAWNHRRSLFRDTDVRRALTMAIDRRALLQLLNYPDNVRIFDVPLLRRHDVQDVVPEPLPYAPERAAALLTGAGWVDVDNDGIREKDGEEFHFTLSVTENESAEAIFIQDQLRRVGVRMEISTYDRSALRDRVYSADFDAAILSYNYIEQFNRFQATGYQNRELSALRDSAWFTVDHTEADRYMVRFWRIFGNEVPITYLHPQVQYRAASRRVMGLANDRDFFANVEHLWIEDH